jgi:hypothetical protein
VTLAGPAAPQAVARASRLRLYNQVSATLVVVGTAAVLMAGFVVLAANRLVSGRPVALWEAAPPALTCVLALFAARCSAYH